MDKDVIISIKGMQSSDERQDEVVEFVTGGKYSNNEKGYKISYLESEMTGLEGTTTTFDVQEGCITLTREGNISSQMVFEPGRKHLSLYDTGFGALTIGVNTRRMLSNLSDGGGDIEIDYVVEIDHAVAGVNAFKINVREPKKKFELKS